MAPRKVVLFDQETLEAIQFDASVSETHAFASQATDHPVEGGVDITDHIRRLPNELTLNVIVSNDPPIILASLRKFPVSGFGDPDTRAQDSVVFLRGLKDNATVVGLDTTLFRYENLYIKSISVVRNARTGNIADMTLGLREIIFATTEQTEAPEPVNPSNKGATSNGSTPKTASTPAVTQSSDSLAARLAGG